MAIRKVIRLGHPTLRKIAKEVDPKEIPTLEFKNLLQDLYDTMKQEGGIGIAAPQINESLQVTLIEIPKNSERYGNLMESPLLTIINPKIKILSEEKQSFWEGCLSVPGLRGKVSRPSEIEISYLDENATEKVIIAKDFLATVFQHEIDHLFGSLYVDLIEDKSQFSFTEEYLEFHLIEKL